MSENTIPQTAEWDGEKMVLRELTADELAELAARQAAAEPTEAQIVAAGMAVIDGLLHRVANSYGYDSIMTMMSYAEEPAVERYQLEGRAARAWRSLCYFKGEQIRDAVKAGDRERPTDDELLAEMPEIDLPYPGPFFA